MSFLDSSFVKFEKVVFFNSFCCVLGSIIPRDCLPVLFNCLSLVSSLFEVLFDSVFSTVDDILSFTINLFPGARECNLRELYWFDDGNAQSDISFTG
ncbi:unnamed protein product [Schistosoma mattheei]|uniref:Uncharacterized protein n=1 Tax=Schistosoma mattheei TaxID=31246 RepID=A0A183Q4D2_9TREM|nr:unnamed protein product [Schistosoma mattheei]